MKERFIPGKGTEEITNVTIGIQGEPKEEIVRGVFDAVKVMTKLYFKKTGERITPPPISITDEVREKLTEVKLPLPFLKRELKIEKIRLTAGEHRRDYQKGQSQIEIYGGSIERAVEEFGGGLYQEAFEATVAEMSHFIREETGRAWPITRLENWLAHPQRYTLKIFNIIKKDFKIGGWGAKKG